MVQPFGERTLKTFIQTSIDEAVHLENALAKLDCPHIVAVLHYSPIQETLKGEPRELYPFLGSGRLASALDRRGVNVIFHGHAHHGSPQGRTPGGIPVYNISRFVLARSGGRAYSVVNV
jgi:Icc-related predicted phosphoesterase